MIIIINALINISFALITAWISYNHNASKIFIKYCKVFIRRLNDFLFCIQKLQSESLFPPPPLHHLSINILLSPNFVFFFYPPFPETSDASRLLVSLHLLLAPCPRHSSNGRRAPVLWRHLRSRSHASVASSNHSVLVNQAEKSLLCLTPRSVLIWKP